MKRVQLSNLLKGAEDATLSGPDRAVTGLTADSRQITKDYLFAAMTGSKFDGRQFIDEAIRHGASAILAPAGTPKPAHDQVAFIESKDPRRTLAKIASAFYPEQPDVAVAVTGTNGKTSTVQFAREIFGALGYSAASIGTLGVVSPVMTVGGSLTTPDTITLHRILEQLSQQGITHLAMEASSHGLDQYRLDGVKLKAAGYTNLTRDHLDYHGTMEAYLAAKMRLFENVLPRDGIAVLNADTPESAAIAERIMKTGRKIMSYGENGKDLRLLSLRPEPHGQHISFEAFGKKHDVMLAVVGRFQVWNSLCALGLAVAAGCPAERSIETLTKLTGVRGRLEPAGMLSNGASIYVDYAHTPDALETVLKALRPHVDSAHGARLVAIFGCGGNRDRGKRPVMGEIAQRLADLAIVTDDNPRNEDAAAIRREILSGCRPAPAVREIGDRALAIRTVIGELKAGDVLVIAGKGHESGQIIGDKVLPFDDVEIARHALKEMAA